MFIIKFKIMNIELSVSNDFLIQRIQVMVSDNKSKEKPKKPYMSKLNFYLKSITIEELIDYIENGYTFSHLFTFPGDKLPIAQKINNEYESNYEGTQIFAIDVDGALHEKEYYFERMTYKSSVMYNTFGDKKEKINKDTGEITYPNKFRCLYFVDTTYQGVDIYHDIYNVLVNQFIKDFNEIPDRSMYNPAQCFHGTIHKDTIVNPVIYSPTDIEDYDNEDIEDNFAYEWLCGRNFNMQILYYNKTERLISKLEKEYEENVKKHNPILLELLKQMEIRNDMYTEEEQIILDQLIDSDKIFIPFFKDFDFWKSFFASNDSVNKNYLVMSYKSIPRFIYDYKDKYPVVKETYVDYNKKRGYGHLTKDYKAIKSYFEYGKKKTYADGTKRRIRIFNTGLKAKEINPNISLEQMVITLLNFFYKNIINNGNKITKYEILKKALQAIIKPVEDISMFNENKQKNKVDIDWCKENDTTPSKHKNKIRGFENQDKVLPYFDINLSFNEILERMESDGISFTLKTLKKHIKNIIKEMVKEEYLNLIEEEIENKTNEIYNRMKKPVGRKKKDIKINGGSSKHSPSFSSNRNELPPFINK